MRRYLFVVSEAVAPAGNVGLALLENGAFYDTILPNETMHHTAPMTILACPMTLATMPD